MVKDNDGISFRHRERNGGGRALSTGDEEEHRRTLSGAAQYDW